MPPTSKKFGRHIGLSLSVCLSVRLCVTLALGQEPLKSRNLVCRMGMKIKKTRIFFLVHRICHCRVIALFIFFTL